VTRTVGASLASHLATKRLKLAHCLRLDLRDGTSLGLTSHNRDLSVDLGDGAITYRADVGAIPSATTLQIGLDADSLEVRGPISETVTRQAIIGGRYRMARARRFDVRWDQPTQFMRLMGGKLTEARVEGGAFIWSIRSNADALNQAIGRVLSPQCSWDFGVYDPPRSRCQATPQTWTGTVASVTDAMRFSVSWDSPAPDAAADLLNGLVEFTTGDLTGAQPTEVFLLSGSPLNDIELYQPLVETPQVGDAIIATEGCDKLRATCKLKNQIENFGAFPDMPGTDDYVKMPVPGS
jgi:uncharacterized phage protein (TIGR02218 family)